MDDEYEDPFPNDPFPDKPKGRGADDIYRSRLEELGYTRVKQNDGRGDLIKIKGVCVWDTVGSLGVPRVTWLDKMGLGASNDE